MPAAPQLSKKQQKKLKKAANKAQYETQKSQIAQAATTQNAASQGLDLKRVPLGTQGGFFKGSEDMLNLFNQFKPEQIQALSQLLQQGLANTSPQNQPNALEGFAPIKQEALGTFQQDIVPYLQNQLSYGGDNAISSPQLHTNLSQAGSGLAQRLASLESQYGVENRRLNQGQQQLGLQQAGLGLTPQYQSVFQNSQPAGWQSLLNNLIGAGGQAAGTALRG